VYVYLWTERSICGYIYSGRDDEYSLLSQEIEEAVAAAAVTFLVSTIHNPLIHRVRFIVKALHSLCTVTPSAFPSKV
jgi:hypothetical protein